MNDDELSDASLLVELFHWDDSRESHYHALLILRKCRGEPSVITWDDFKAGISR